MKKAVEGVVGQVRHHGPSEYQKHGCRCDICCTAYREQGVVRGILCVSCNTGMGMLKDDVEVLEKAILYLKASKGNVVNSVIEPNPFTEVK